MIVECSLETVEHINELTTPGRFLRDAFHGVLPSGGQATQRANVGMDFFDMWRRNWMVNVPPLPGGFNSQVPNMRVFEALGSTTNSWLFVLLVKALNGLKSRVGFT